MYLILRRSLLVNFAVLFALSSLASAAPECHGIFMADTHNSKAIETTIEQLAAYRVKLDVARAEGQSSAALSAMEADYTKKEKSLVVHIKKNHLMSLEELREKLISATARIQNQKSKELETEKDKKEDQVRAMDDVLIHDGREMIFYPIKPGTFNILETWYHPAGKVKIEKPFEMMSTHVTRFLWKQIVDLAPLTEIKIENKTSDASGSPNSPLSPITNVNHKQVTEWLKVLNELSRMGADLSGIIVGHQKGDVYRLPTADQWEFVASKRGENTSMVLFEESLLPQYEWYAENSGHMLHEVATKKPLEFEGMKFFDMVGNVQTMTSDIEKPRWGNVPQVITKGGNFDLVAFELGRTWITHLSIPYGSDKVGIRLIREGHATGTTP